MRPTLLSPAKAVLVDRRVIAATFPEEVVRAGLIGPRLSALIAYQKGACHMSYTSIEKFFDDVLHLDVSRGQLAKVVQKGSAALGPCYAELQAALPEQRALNVDETGHPECGKKLWAWGFHAPGAEGLTWFRIDPSRSEAQNIAERFREYGEYYFTFLKVPGVEPTNNAMERGFRHSVIDRKVT